jgi:hypothetical protein
VATGTFEHAQIEANDIAVHTVSVGRGPLVVFCDGFPESWYSWRHQLPAVAEAGFSSMVHPRTVSTNSGAPIPVRIGSMTSSGSKDESQLSSGRTISDALGHCAPPRRISMSTRTFGSLA